MAGEGQCFAGTGTNFAEQPPCCLFVVFGATGDLTARKIAPALYNLLREGLLQRGTVVLGVARRELSDEQFRDMIFQALAKHSRSQPIDQAMWKDVAPHWHYQSVRFDQEQDFHALAGRIKELETSHGLGGYRLLYLAIAPDMLKRVVCNLGQAQLNQPAATGGCVRVVVEKPYGGDLASAKDLNECILRVFQESQVCRIDHYLGKETVQNLLVLRFANAVFDPLFSRQFVDHVQITTAESAGMEGRRGAYYETAGALRDMVQSHMLQLLALVAMDCPSHMDEQSIRNEKVKVLQAIAPMTPEQVVQAHGPRPIRRSRRTGRLPPGTGSLGRQPGGNLRGADPLRGHLAMGGRAVPPADGQGLGGQGQPDPRRVQTRADRPVH